MSSDEIDPPSPELESLYATILPRTPITAAGTERLRARLDATIRELTPVVPDGAPPSAPAAPTRAPRWPFGAGMFALGFGAGLAAMALLRPPARVVEHVVQREVVTVRVPAEAPGARDDAGARAAAPDAGTRGQPLAVPPRWRRDTRGGAVAQGESWRARERLDVVEHELEEGRAPRAIELLEGHARDFPRLGPTLVQYRELLWIRALADTGQRAAAQRRAARFLAAFPRSPYRALVERETGAQP